MQKVDESDLVMQTQIDHPASSAVHPRRTQTSIDHRICTNMHKQTQTELRPPQTRRERTKNRTGHATANLNTDQNLTLTLTLICARAVMRPVRYFIGSSWERLHNLLVAHKWMDITIP